MLRRSFLGGLFGTAAVISRPDLAAGLSQAAREGDIPTRIFGKTGEKLTVIGQAGGRLGLVSRKDAKEVVRRAYDLGINYFDCAHTYWDGKSEEVFGEVLAPVRKNIFLTSKTYERTAREAEAQLQISLKRLRTDYLDLWQIHGVGEMSEVEKIFGPGGAIEAFEAAKKAGKCRFIGFTGHRDPYVHLKMLQAYDKYDTILMPLNPVDPGYLSFEKLVLPVAVGCGLGIQGMKNFGNAQLLQSLSVRDCLSYALSLPIHCTAIGCTTIGQLEDDVRIVRSFKPLETVQMDELRRRVRSLQGPGIENWKIKPDTAKPVGGV